MVIQAKIGCLGHTWCGVWSMLAHQQHKEGYCTQGAAETFLLPQQRATDAPVCWRSCCLCDVPNQRHHWPHAVAGAGAIQAAKT